MNQNQPARMEATNRRNQILDAALTLSVEIGYKCITRDAVAKCAGISSALIANYFPRMVDLKLAVMQTAIEERKLEIIAQGMSISDPLTLELSEELKGKVLQHLSLK